MSDATRRFSDRVEDYIRFRPGYPEELITFLLDQTGLGTRSRAADIGSGTGIFSHLLLNAGLVVYAVEPNPEMRAAAENLHADHPGFHSIAAPAEATGLDDQSLDLVTAAQAFHWFNNEPTRSEFTRILKAEGYLALIWNRRRIGQDFQREYEAVLRRRAPEYSKVNHMNLDNDDIGKFFAPDSLEKLTFDNRQQFDFDGLLGRVKSSSYCPMENSDEFELLRDDLRVLFEKHRVDGTIDFEYDTDLYLGRIHR